MDRKALRDVIEAAILRGELAPGDRLPTQDQLARDHGLSRHAVRCALRDLQARDLVRSEQGRGCYIAETCLTHSLTAMQSLAQDAIRQGHEITSETLAIWRGRDRRSEAGILGRDMSGDMVVAERLAYLNGRVFQVVRDYVCTKRVTIDESALDRATNLAEMLRAGGVRHCARTKSRVTVRKVTAAERVLLGIAPSQPVIDLFTYWGDGTAQPIAATHSVTRADRLALEA